MVQSPKGPHLENILGGCAYSETGAYLSLGHRHQFSVEQRWCGRSPVHCGRAKRRPPARSPSPTGPHAEEAPKHAQTEKTAAVDGVVIWSQGRLPAPPFVGKKDYTFASTTVPEFYTEVEQASIK